MTSPAPLLALDTASPVASVAVGAGGGIVGEESMARTATARELLSRIDSCLKRGGIARQELAGVLLLRGPGSFTGLRIGLATALAMHEALAIPALAVPTLPVLASCAAGAGAVSGDPRPIVACVDALRGEWFCQRFDDALEGDSSPWRLPDTDPQRCATEELRRFAPARFVGHELASLAARVSLEGSEILEAGPLAGTLLRWHARVLPPWNPASLLAPLYLREAATSRGGGAGRVVDRA
jgi:tRNA threonylcarbamoyl adenosine modification protein YeaZ